MAESYNLRASRETHKELDHKLAKANIRRAKYGKKQLSKGAVVSYCANKLTIKELENI